MAVWQRLPGSARRWVDLETGREYSRRQKEAITGRSLRKDASIVRKKQKLYYSLLDSYIDKQIELGKYEPSKGKNKYRGLRKKARESDEMKKIVRDLKSKDPFRKLQALKKSARRDNIPDSIPVGESPKAYSEAA